MTRSSSDHVADAWANTAARGLLADLADRGVTVSVMGGRLDVRPASLVTADDVAQLRAHKPDLLLLVLVCDERTLDRLLDLRRAQVRGAPRMAPDASTPDHCNACGGALPAHRGMGRCGWCALAGRLYAGAPLTRDVLGLFDAAIVGPHAHVDGLADATSTTPRLDLDGAA